MSLGPGAWVSNQEAADIHLRLLGGDPTASYDFACAFLEPLTTWLSHIFPSVDPHNHSTAAEDAIINLIKRPSIYDPNRGGLAAYLRMSAKRDLQNLLRKETRRQSRHVSLEVVELSSEGWKLSKEGSDPADIYQAQVVMEDLQGSLEKPPVPEQILADLSAQESQVLHLMRQGERKTSAFAEILDIQSMPAAQQKLEVKRVKDRLKRRIERAGGSK
jgi:RNA polymerase sigma-70 factor (ECF subfamily)